MVIFYFVSPTHSCVSANWNQYINLACICVCGDRINLSSKFVVRQMSLLRMTHNGSMSFMLFESHYLEKIYLVTCVMATKTLKWCTCFVSTRLIWRLKHLGKEGRKSLVSEENAAKPVEEILEDRIMIDDWSSGQTHSFSWV